MSNLSRRDQSAGIIDEIEEIHTIEEIADIQPRTVY